MKAENSTKQKKNQLNRMKHNKEIVAKEKINKKDLKNE